MWNMTLAIAELHTIFHFLNDKIFKNELPEPAITIQSRGKRNALGWCTTLPIWVDKDHTERRHEINICAEYIGLLTPVNVAEIVLHEMVHYYGDLHSIQTTSRNGNFHNKKFKDLCGYFGLNVEKTDLYGYSQTSLTADTKKLVEEANFKQDAFKLLRLPDEGKISKHKSSIKHKCPNCGNTARTTKEMTLICGECNEEMNQEVPDDEDD